MIAAMPTALSLLMCGGMIGLTVSVPVGPMSLLCISRVLRGGFVTGASPGAGATTIHVLYLTLAMAGLQGMRSLATDARPVFQLAGGLLMLLFALRTLRRRRPVAIAATGEGSPLVAYGSAAMFNMMNPLSPLLLAAALTSFVPSLPVARIGSLLILAGAMVGSLSWWLVLSATVAGLRDRLVERALMQVYVGAGAFMLVLGLASLLRSFHG